MFFRYSRQGRYLVVAVILVGLLMGFATTTTGATPFSSPQPDNKLHQPLVTNDTGEPTPQSAKVESQGIPVMWIILLFVFLFIPAAALMAARRR